MCSINHELKAIYIHIPKNGGLYVEDILNKYYGFKTLYYTRPDHYKFMNDNDTNINFDSISLANGFINIRKQGIFRYCSTSDEYNKIMDMDEEKWKTYRKFTFVRNPYTKIVSAYKYLVQIDEIPFEKLIENKDSVNNYIYTHAFISQYEHLLNKDEKIEIEFIGRFENLNEDLVEILLKLGVNKIKHSSYIKNNLTINSSKYKNTNYTEYYSDNMVKVINHLFIKDFETFNYPKLNSYDQLLNYSNSTSTNSLVNFENKNKELYDRLDKENKLDVEEKIIINLNNVQDNVHDNTHDNPQDNLVIELDNFDSSNKINFNPLYNENYIMKNNIDSIKEKHRTEIVELIFLDLLTKIRK